MVMAAKVAMWAEGRKEMRPSVGARCRRNEKEDAADNAIASKSKET